MRFRVPTIESVTTAVFFTVAFAVILFSFSLFLHTRQVRENYIRQYNDILSGKKNWVESEVFSELNYMLQQYTVPGEHDILSRSSFVECCFYEVKDDTIVTLVAGSSFFPDAGHLKSIRTVAVQKQDTGSIFISSLQPESQVRYFMANTEHANSFGKVCGILAVYTTPVDTLLNQLLIKRGPILQSALLMPDGILYSAGVSSCIKNEISFNSLTGNNMRFFTCETDKEKKHLLFTQTPLYDEVQLILIFKQAHVFTTPLYLLVFSFLLLLAGILIFPVIERKRYQKQVRDIHHVVESISEKDFTTIVSEKYPGELGKLARSINKMSNQLKEIYEDLEIRVIRRTSEISLRNAELRNKQREILQQNQELVSAYDALKESREKYEKLIEHLKDEYFFYSEALNATLLFVSPSVKTILGYEVKEYRKIHRNIHSKNPLNKIAHERKENLKTGVAQPKYLKAVFDVNRNEKILEISEVPVFNEDEQLVAIEGLAHDITERQKAEELIKEQEEKYRMLFTHASDFIFLYKLNREKKVVGNIIEANNYTLNRLGYTIDELREMSPLDILSELLPDEGNVYHELVNDDLKFERVWKSKDDQLIDVEISTHAFTMKDKEVAIAVARDITERKKAEEEIRFVNEELVNQKENLESLVDNLTETREQLVQSEKMAALGQLIAGIAHEINTPLGAIKASIGNMLDSLDRALGELPELFHKQSVENLRLFNAIFDKARVKKPEFTSREKRQKRRDISSLIKEQHIPDADLIADSLVFLEIYEVDETLLPQLKNSEALKVVRSARNFISLMKNTNTINIAVEKATKVVFALKKYAHRDAMGKKISTDITDSIETVLTLYNNQFKQGVEIIRQYDKLPLVPCYQDEISQVWTNLIQNAIQAMHFEGVLTITTKNEGSFVSVSFKDTGPGIEPDIREKIFEPFFTTKKQGEGSGLGLDLVKKIIEKHNGTIELESTLGEGAEFVVKIPLEIKETEESEYE